MTAGWPTVPRRSWTPIGRKEKSIKELHLQVWTMGPILRSFALQVNSVRGKVHFIVERKSPHINDRLMIASLTHAEFFIKNMLTRHFINPHTTERM